MAGGRGGYYDNSGALRDMVQNHLMQLLCLVAMEPPSDLQPDSVRNEKVKVLRSLRPIERADVAKNLVRGQYVRGVVEGQQVAGYLEEKGAESETETFVAIQAHIDNWRWAGVPFFLRTGKRLPEKDTEIFIQFKGVPHSIFSGESRADLSPNSLLIRLQPEEDIVLRLMNQAPGLSLEGMRLQSLPLSLSLKTVNKTPVRRRIAYERLILDALHGVSTLFVRRDEIEKAWEWVDGVNQACRRAGQSPRPYAAGSWGPSGSFALIERVERTWHDPTGV
jgi:glucose-6-phosphate 1-dehydrogenase